MLDDLHLHRRYVNSNLDLSLSPLIATPNDIHLTGRWQFSSEADHANTQVLVCQVHSWQARISHTSGDLTLFVVCHEIYTVADFFAVSPLATTALDALDEEFNNKLSFIQLFNAPADTWLPELFAALRLVYAHDPTAVDKSDEMSPIRAAFVRFVYTARFFFLELPVFNRFLDEEAPAFALDLFRAMRQSCDFLAWAPERCSSCKTKPRYGDLDYFTQLTPEMLKLTTCCSKCARVGKLGAPDNDWSDKVANAAVARAEKTAANAPGPLATFAAGMLTVRLPVPPQVP